MLWLAAAGVLVTDRRNMGGYATKRTTPELPLETVERLGFNLVIFPLALTRAGVRAMVDFVAGLRARGAAFEVRQFEAQYLPPAAVEQKYAGGQGYRP